MKPSVAGGPNTAPVRVERIRRRLVWALLGPFCILMSVSAVEGFSPAGPGRVTAIAVLIGSALVVPVLMAWLARAILREVQALDTERQQFSELYGRARHDALVDGLTGQGNHRAFQDELARQIEIAKRQGMPVALMLVDVDNLKSVNDTQGHAGGDRLLEAVGRVTATVLRRSDRAFRVGGDEFAILLPGTDLDTGLAVARRVLASALTRSDTTGGSSRSRSRSASRRIRRPAPRATTSTATPTPPCTGASGMAGPRPWHSIPVGTAPPPTIDRWVSSRRRSGPSSIPGR